MLKSIMKINNNFINKNINKNIINVFMILLILLMLIIIFWMFFKTLWRTITNTILKEGFDPKAPLPTSELVSVQIIQDEAPITSFSKPPPPKITPLGKYYLTTEKNSTNLNIITLGKDPSGVLIDFDASLNTRLMLYPVNIAQPDETKGNIFPDFFTVKLSFLDMSKNFLTKYIDVSGDDIRNSIINYVSPTNDASGSFADIILGYKNFKSAIYENSTSSNNIGSVIMTSNNNYTINITQSGSLLNGIIIDLQPPA